MIKIVIDNGDGQCGLEIHGRRVTLFDLMTANNDKQARN